MCFSKKCNWCDQYRNNVFIIKKRCKWYNFKICDECYENKINFEPLKRPVSKPQLYDCIKI